MPWTMPLPIRLAAGLSLLVAGAPAGAPAGAQPVRTLLTPTAGIPATAAVPPRPLTADDVAGGTLRAGPVRFDRAFHAELRRAFTGGLEAPARTVAVSPFSDVTFHLVLRRSPAAAAASGAATLLQGEARQVGGAGAVGTYALALYGSELTLSIFSPAGNYHVRYGLDARLEAYQEDPSAPVSCANLRRAPGAPTAPADASGAVTVLVLYTPEAVSAIGGDEEGLQAEIAKGLDLVNAAFRDSGVRLTARLATGRALPVPGAFRQAAGVAADLQALGRSAEAAELRRRHAADVVVLARGRADAWSMTDAGLAVVQARKLADGLALAHALGHALGAGHDPDAADSAGGAPYARGWHGGVGVDARQGGHVGTIMSHVGRRIPYFSSPSVRYQGVPIGSEAQDNARALNRAARP
jgi:hypothetical protein